MPHMSPRLKARRGRFGPGGLKGPNLTITSPANGFIFLNAGSPTTLFTATSFDDLDGDISAAVTWTVGLGSPLAVEATGASVDLNAFLTFGSPQVAQVVTATSTDSGGKVSTKQITVTA